LIASATSSAIVDASTSSDGGAAGAAGTGVAGNALVAVTGGVADSGVTGMSCVAIGGGGAEIVETGLVTGTARVIGGASSLFLGSLWGSATGLVTGPDVGRGSATIVVAWLGWLGWLGWPDWLDWVGSVSAIDVSLCRPPVDAVCGYQRSIPLG
jgi:hypothetical protein